jgi:hypothetical protein
MFPLLGLHDVGSESMDISLMISSLVFLKIKDFRIILSLDCLQAFYVASWVNFQWDKTHYYK